MRVIIGFGCVAAALLLTGCGQTEGPAASTERTTVPALIEARQIGHSMFARHEVGPKVAEVIMTARWDAPTQGLTWVQLNGDVVYEDFYLDGLPDSIGVLLSIEIRVFDPEDEFSTTVFHSYSVYPGIIAPDPNIGDAGPDGPVEQLLGLAFDETGHYVGIAWNAGDGEGAHIMTAFGDGLELTRFTPNFDEATVREADLDELAAQALSSGLRAGQD